MARKKTLASDFEKENQIAGVFSFIHKKETVKKVKETDEREKETDKKE